VDAPERLEERMLAGQWLLPGEAAKLLGIGRTSVHRKIVDGEIGHRVINGWRRCNPADVGRLLAEYREEHRGSPPAPTGDELPNALPEATP